MVLMRMHVHEFPEQLPLHNQQGNQFLQYLLHCQEMIRISQREEVKVQNEFLSNFVGDFYVTLNFF